MGLMQATDADAMNEAKSAEKYFFSLVQRRSSTEDSNNGIMKYDENE